MKTFLLAILTIALWVAVFAEGANVFFADLEQADALDRCLYAGHSPSACMEGGDW